MLRYKALTQPMRSDLRKILAEIRFFSKNSYLKFFKRKSDLSLYNSGQPLLVNLGCGNRIHSNWINIDLSFPSSESYYADLREPLPFPDKMVNHIHCEHFLEHLQLEDAVNF
jgi:hypothetical protein